MISEEIIMGLCLSKGISAAFLPLSMCWILSKYANNSPNLPHCPDSTTTISAMETSLGLIMKEFQMSVGQYVPIFRQHILPLKTVSNTRFLGKHLWASVSVLRSDRILHHSKSMWKPDKYLHSQSILILSWPCCLIWGMSFLLAPSASEEGMV